MGVLVSLVCQHAALLVTPSWIAGGCMHARADEMYDSKNMCATLARC
jgi:hypothetical protein